MRLATGADRVLIAAGTLDEEAYLRMQGAALGIPFEPLDGMPRAQCPLDDDRLIETASTGLLPLTTDDGIVIVVAPRGAAVRKIIGLIGETPGMEKRFRFTSAERFTRFILRGAGKRIAANATETLRRERPMLSAAARLNPSNLVSLTVIVPLAAAGFIWAPHIASHAFEIALAAVFVAWLGLRLIGAFVRRPAAATTCRTWPRWPERASKRSQRLHMRRDAPTWMPRRSRLSWRTPGRPRHVLSHPGLTWSPPPRRTTIG